MLCVGIYMLNIGIEKINASVTSFINMIEPVTSLIVSAVVFAYSISALNLVGCVLILASMVFATRDG